VAKQIESLQRCADVAHLMLRVLEQPETIEQVIGIAN
jgi:hypothetical protein